ncbi:MAG TPA: ROK family protein [Pelolinea sp.]|nr:ROK family protein [Pelolinea sp.]
MKLYGGIEAGGTKFVCMIGRNPDEILKEERFLTTNPSDTIKRAIDFFRPYTRNNELAALGIGSFGPVDLNPASQTFGFITTTPKPGWNNVDLRGEIQRGLNVPVAFDTDVNAAAFGEQYWLPENRLLDPFIYITIGTGIGVGVIINGSLLHGLVHTEAGHMAIPHDWQKDPFPGICPFHGDCWEGLASGISISKRWMKKPEELPDTHPAWELETEYIAFALVNLIYAYSPMRIILGGGVSQHAPLHRSIHKKIQQINNSYVQSPFVMENIKDYILPPSLGNRSGGLGAIALAITLANQ